MVNKDSITNTFQVAGALCVVCSLMVSATAIGLRETQQNNVVLDKKKNILQVAGFSAEEVKAMDAAKIESFFARGDQDAEKDNGNEIEISDIVVDLTTGDTITEEQLKEKISQDTVISSYDQEKQAKKVKEGLAVNMDVSLIGLKEHERFSHVYIVRNRKKDEISRYVFPVKGKGLWSTLFGYIAVDASFQQIEGLTFYKHAETPGLGGEVDNPKWKKLWEGRMIYDEAGDLAKEYVVKGTTPADNPNAVDGLSGATITSKGVSNLVRFWLSDEGFGKFMEQATENSSK